MRVIVFGGTGDQGRAQVRALAASGHDAVAVSRSGAAVEAVRPVEGAAVDLGDAAGLARVVEGAGAVFLNLPSTSFQAAEPLVTAAETIARASRAAGVGILVFNTSLPVPEHRLGFAAQDARHEMRQRILDLGPPAIVLQPVVFLDNLLRAWAWPSIAQDGVVLYPHDETLEVSWICHDDLAALMVAGMDRPALAGRVLDVGGPDTVRGPELARRLGAAWGRRLRFESQSVEAFCARMSEVFRDVSTLESRRLIDELGRIYRWYNTAPERPFRVDMAPVLELLPVRLTRIEEWAAHQSLPA